MPVLYTGVKRRTIQCVEDSTLEHGMYAIVRAAYSDSCSCVHQGGWQKSVIGDTLLYWGIAYMRLRHYEEAHKSIHYGTTTCSII